MKKIKDSIVAYNKSTIKNSSIRKNNVSSYFEKKSFVGGFLTGIITSLIASAIWSYFEKYF